MKSPAAFAIGLVAAVLLVTIPSAAQDKGNTEAAKLTKESQKALSQLASARFRWPKRSPPRR